MQKTAKIFFNTNNDQLVGNLCIILFTLGYSVGRIAITLFDLEIKTLCYLIAVVYLCFERFILPTHCTQVQQDHFLFGEDSWPDRVIISQADKQRILSTSSLVLAGAARTHPCWAVQETNTQSGIQRYFCTLHHILTSLRRT